MGITTISPVFVCWLILTKPVCLLINQKILGARLNKTRRNSNWEQRPLTENQVIAPLSSFLFINALHIHKTYLIMQLWSFLRELIPSLLGLVMQSLFYVVFICSFRGLGVGG